MTASHKLTSPGASWRALFRSVFVIVLIFSACLAAPAGDPATIAFSVDFPKSNPEHYSITVQNDGQARYESTGKLTPDSDAGDPFQSDFQLSHDTRTRIFDLAAQAKYFSGKVDSGKKNLAFTGAKKLTYTDGQHHSSAEFNFSNVPAVQQLTVLFQSVGATLEYGRRLAYFRRYQKLALDDELKRMEGEVRRGELTELQAVKPILQEIYDDASVMNVGRARARRIMDMAPALK
jgi:hypothetical protein